MLRREEGVQVEPERLLKVLGPDLHALLRQQDSVPPQPQRLSQVPATQHVSSMTTRIKAGQVFRVPGSLRTRPFS